MYCNISKDLFGRAYGPEGRERGMRKLFYAPLIHSRRSREFSEASKYLDDSKDKPKYWWRLVSRLIDPHLHIDRVYFDSITESPSGDSRFQKSTPEALTLNSLLDRGATIEMTEDASLIEEFDSLMREAVTGLESDDPIADGWINDYEDRQNQNLRKRDEFISRKIDETLRVGEVGVLLVGADHNVLPLLPRDIKIQHLDPELDELIKEGKILTFPKKERAVQ